MKNRDIMSFVDDKYIYEASPLVVKRDKKKRRKVMFAAIAACMFIAIGLWLFIPFERSGGNIKRYSESEYYEVISAIDHIYNSRIQPYANNFEKYFSEVSVFISRFTHSKNNTNGGAYGDSGFINADINTENALDSYHETTDNQVEGVKEGDLIKRSDKYIFYYDIENKAIRVYSIDGEESCEVSSFYIESVKPGLRATGGDEMYLSDDCRTLTVILDAPFSYGEYTVLSLDVSDVTNIKVKRTVKVKGSCISSRVVDGMLILVSNYSMESNVDFDNIEEYVPALDTGEGLKYISGEDIMVSPNVTTTRYTVISCFREDDLSEIGSVALMSYGSTMYVSRDNIYVCFAYYKKDLLGNIKTFTEIASIGYSGDKLEINGSAVVEGVIRNQYCMDEYNGYLRVAVSNEVSASLYCISLEDYEIKGKVENFAPKGEVVQSARFKENTAYVCTSIEFCDPVFFFDLTDVKNITYKETDEIPGFSSSLIDFGEGYLLGVGVDGRNSAKIEIYVEGKDKIEVLCSYIASGFGYKTDYKSYYINREDGLFGMIYYSNKTEGKHQYILLSFDGHELFEKAVIDMTEGVNNPRAVIIDGFMYLFGENYFSVTNLN